jgi:hypothetical protein
VALVDPLLMVRVLADLAVATVAVVVVVTVH